MSSEQLPKGMLVLERGWLSSNMLVVLGETQAAVVDTGYWTHSSQTVDLVVQALRGRVLNSIVNTHLHSDHCGGNAALQARFPDALTWVPPGQAQAARDWDEEALTYRATGQHCPPFRVNAVLPVGGAVSLGDYVWEVHAAPGHDPHSVVLYEGRSRTLVSADALWENGFGVVFQELEGDRAFEEVSGTLDVIEKLRPARVVPGHGPVFTDVASALSRARSRLAAYRADPERHAIHAAKVLIKFKLLEVQSQPVSAFLDWAERTPYLALVRNRFFPDRDLRTWASALIEDLVRGGAARLQGQQLSNA